MNPSPIRPESDPYRRAYQFSAGPSALPLPVLEQIRQDLPVYANAGCSVLEMSHRSKEFMAIAAAAEASLRRLMAVPEDYAVLFLQGGASLQFSMVPMNLARRGQAAEYALTGSFAEKALAEAQRWCDARAVVSGKDDHYRAIPSIDPAQLRPEAAYLHITGNNTIYGTAYQDAPDTDGLPLVADWSSAILGQQIDVSKYALIYAGAQKNMGPAGLTVALVKRNALPAELDDLVPSMLRYAIHDKNGSMYNTPPCFALYAAGLVFRWAEEQGGVAALETLNRQKSGLLYAALDRSRLFHPLADPGSRSLMNVTFTLPDAETSEAFLALAKQRGLNGLKGHRSVGGFRASLYNAVPLAAVEELVRCMQDFEDGLRA